ncbi:MAG: hypothetical protein QY318_01775 [Candidatus Dojkabacteria bacterium]|nr:MAG: hypothetical protein QY318_01775 [Candidatus Dojkabacteria bacterium]
MITSKALAMYLSVRIFDITLYIDDNIESLFSVQLYIDNFAQAQLVESVSNLAMLLSMGTVFGYIMIRYILYENSRHDPRTIVKLTKLNMTKWVTSKDTVFLKIFVWALFLFITCAIVISSTLKGMTYLWIGVAAFVTIILTGWGLVRAFESEFGKVFPSEHSNGSV